MKNRFLVALFLVLVKSRVTFADGNNEVKRGTYPYMAFIYYPDETVVENGARFFRSAVLIKPEWLISSAIDHPDADGFPWKTLLARVGAVTINGNVALNEDEDEQEREVIQIVRPTIHNRDLWYFTDITLLQTLLPFNLTSAVDLAPFNIKPKDNSEKSCLILVYARKYENSTEDRNLLQMSVELVVPSNTDNCGAEFSPASMTCALDTDETKNSLHDPNYCQGNAGGPLVCDSEVVGVQTYINSACKPPHLYQLLSGWNNLITCGTEKRCSQEYCSSTCTTTDKDPPTTEMTVSHTPERSDQVAVETSEVPQSVAEITATSASLASPDTQASSESSESTATSLNTIPTSTTTAAAPEMSESLTTTTTSPTTTTKTTTMTTTSFKPTTHKTTKTTTTAPTTESTRESSTEANTPTERRFSWRNEDKKTKASELKVHDIDRSEEDTEAPFRRAYVEAQVATDTQKSFAGSNNMGLLQSLLLGVLTLVVYFI